MRIIFVVYKHEPYRLLANAAEISRLFGTVNHRFFDFVEVLKNNDGYEKATDAWTYIK